MSDINTVTIVGRMTRDAELKYGQSGTAVLKGAIASNYWNGKENAANFLDFVVFGKRAESVGQYLTKGTQIALHGELRQNRWEQDGQKRSKVEIVANSVQLLGGKQDGPLKAEPPKPAQNDFIDDVPF